ncbi:anti-anti-sigma factor [Streptosporangium becharense]|uniref:Anti-sigma factor antagonist n=1 Tax=Streptosporangium becharense TaxID=1816182 RepID=A0A7W9IG39_9ACTN|nr:STAS domain-containing protein [Streptosporangium becharense]MBB2909081.1 anti-anti-sigma factor [Streptosporangium becharense]MBB5819901.1 anti-anti-sigma factor [Streptosporangium becharense]
MTTPLAVSVREHDGACVIVLVGELDKLSSPLLRDALTARFDRGASRVVLDVAGLRFCDSTGLWVMLDFRRRAGEAGGCLRLAGATGVLERLLTLTGLTGVFPLDPDVPAALRAAVPPSPVPKAD